MRNVLADVDEYVMSHLVEPLLWEIQYQTGAAQGRIIRVVLDVAMITLQFGLALTMQNGLQILYWALFSAVLLWIMDETARRTFEGKYYGSVQTRNPWRLRWDFRLCAAVAYLLLLMYMYWWIESAMGLSIVAVGVVELILHTCLLCADGMTPSQRSERERRSLGRMRQGATS